MKTIVIRTQKEMDELPGQFNEYTVIEIRSIETVSVTVARGNSHVVARENSHVEARGNSHVEARGNSHVVALGNSRVEAWGNSHVVALENSHVEARENSHVEARGNSHVVARENSHVEARGNSHVEARGNSHVVALGNSRVEAWGNSHVVALGNSRVEAWDNSHVEAWGNSQIDCFLCSFLVVYSASVKIRSLLDNSRLIYKTSIGQRPEKQDPTAFITEYEEIITPSFEQWLDRGFVVADGIYQKLVSQKTIGEVTIYETDKGFVAQKGDKFAHGETIEEAKSDLRYKLSDRDTSKYESWKLDDIKQTDELIESYMAITGACSFGTKQFCESIQLKDSYTVKEIIGITRGKYGNEQYEEFFNV